MKLSIVKWQVIGFLFTSAAGPLLHFLYDLTGKSIGVAPFSALNESVWEHMKILFFPLLVFTLFQGFWIKDSYPAFLNIKLKGILLGLVLLPVIFYTYNGAFGKSPDWFNIAIFYITAATVYIFETREFKKANLYPRQQKIAIAALAAIAMIFVIFSFYPPELPLFTE